MDKQTKTLVMVAVVGVGAFLLYKQFKPKTTAFNGFGKVGNRMRGLTGVAENMTPKNSNWIRPTLNGKLLKNASGMKTNLTGVNENAQVQASPFSWR